MASKGRSRQARRAVAALVTTLASLVVAGNTAPVGAAGPADTAGLAVPTIAWRPCSPGDSLQCASVRVPLDYGRPTGPQITLSVNRLPALDPAHRLGSIFLNPGGPGGSGVDMVSEVAFGMSVAFRGRFDIVGFDPRGIARSTPLVCFTDATELGRAAAPWPYPLGSEQERRQEQYDRQLAQSCSAHASSIIDHMSTADVARDLDLLRAAVGDSSLTYLGYSYGTQIGTTYANLFPHRVRAIVLDGVLDPVAWTTGTSANRAPFSYRLHSDLGAQATLEQFFVRCDRAATDTDPATTCAFGPHARGALRGARPDAATPARPTRCTDRHGAGVDRDGARRVVLAVRVAGRGRVAREPRASRGAGADRGRAARRRRRARRRRDAHRSPRRSRGSPAWAAPTVTTRRSTSRGP